MADRKVKFTTAICNKLAGPDQNSDAKAIEYSDTMTLRLKLSVSRTGVKIWYWRYQFEGAKRVIRLGSYPGIGVDEARKLALENGALLDKGIDPQHALDEQMEIPTFEDFALKLYLPYAEKHKRSHGDDESKLRVHLFKVFGHKRLDKISRYDVEIYLAGIASSHCSATSNRHLALLSRMFNLAIGWGVIDKSPCAGIKKLAERNHVGRDFKAHEIQALRNAWSKDANQQAAKVLDLLLFTGLRLREVLHARWENVDLETGCIYLPLTKSGKARHVALNDVAKDILVNIQREADSPWVFPGKNPSKPVNNINNAWQRALKLAGIGHARIHDLRHQFATSAVKAGVSLYNVQGLLGHANSSTTQRYAHHTDDALRNASQQTAASLLG